MQNILISTIRFGAIAVLAFSVFIGEAFAAPVLTPASAATVSETNATLVAKMANPGEHNTAVWFEWGETQALGNSAGMRDIFGEGFFQGYLRNLKPGTTYYFRAGALEGGVTVYSPIASFKTRGGAEDAPVASVTQGATVSTAPASLATSNTVSAPSNTAQSSSLVAKNTNTSNTTNTAKNTTTNSNTAAVANAGSGMLPGTLIGWIALLIALLIIFLIFAILLDSVEERRKAREAARKKQRLVEEDEHQE